MRNLVLLAAIAGVAYYGAAFNPGVGLFQEQAGSLQLGGIGAKACKYNTLHEGTKTLLLSNLGGSSEDGGELKCPQFVLLNDERLGE